MTNRNYPAAPLRHKQTHERVMPVGPTVLWANITTDITPLSSLKHTFFSNKLLTNKLTKYPGAVFRELKEIEVMYESRPCFQEVESQIKLKAESRLVVGYLDTWRKCLRGTRPREQNTPSQKNICYFSYKLKIILTRFDFRRRSFWCFKKKKRTHLCCTSKFKINSSRKCKTHFKN